MARMLGERVMPESVTAKRRQLRSRIQDLREPVRSKREDLVPGPNVIGKLESQVNQLRTSVVERDSVLSRIRNRGDGSSSGSGSNTSSSGESSGSSGSSSVSSMT